MRADFLLPVAAMVVVQNMLFSEKQMIVLENFAVQKDPSVPVSHQYCQGN